VSTPGLSFWRQDVNWYIQQQSWTQPFYQADQNWTAELHPASTAVPTNQPTGAASIADQKVVTLVNTPSAQAVTGALQASGARSGALVDLLT
jgi:hypothetical protein